MRRRLLCALIGHSWLVICTYPAEGNNYRCQRCGAATELRL